MAAVARAIASFADSPREESDTKQSASREDVRVRSSKIIPSEYARCRPEQDQFTAAIKSASTSDLWQPFAFNSSRIASDRLKSFALRAACRSSSSAFNSAGTSASGAAPTPSTESTRAHAANAAAACGASSAFSAARRFVCRTHSKTTPHAPEIFKSLSNASANAASSAGSGAACVPPAISRNFARHSSIRRNDSRALSNPFSVKLNVSR